MKKLITTNTGKHPFTLADLGFMQDSYMELVKALVEALAADTNPALVLVGCDITLVAGSDYNNSAGFVFFNGELYAVDASSTPIDFDATPVVLEPIVTYAVPSPVTYKNLSVKNVHHVRKARFIETANAADLGNAVLWSSFKRNAIIDTWHVVGAGGEPAFSSGFTTIAGLYQKLRFRLNRDGDLEIDGAFGVASGTNGELRAFRLDDGWRPAKTQYIVVNHYINGSGFEYGYMEIDTDGWVKIVNNAAGGGNGYYINRQTVCMT